MSETSLMQLPICPGNKDHGQMVLRPIEHQTPEQRFCGVWYDCMAPGCPNSVLLPSKELREIYTGRPIDKEEASGQ